MRVSVIVPTLDEAAHVRAVLSDLQPLRNDGEIIIVDGGSSDRTVELAEPFADRVIRSATPGRARQMNAGAAVARGRVLWFVHADTRIGGDALAALAGLNGANPQWGRFDIRIDSTRPLLLIVAWMMNRRSRLTGIATGDQGIFVRSDVFATVGGFPDIPLMEDIAISRKLRATSRPHFPSAQLLTSGRRWERQGVLRTIVLMWRLRWAYWRGADPDALALRYRNPDS